MSESPATVATDRDDPRESQARLTRDAEAAEGRAGVGDPLGDVGASEEPYEQILDVAVALLGADFAGLQRLDADRGTLRLLAWKNFDPRSAEFWRTVSIDDGTPDGSAVRHGRRVVVPDWRVDDSLRRAESRRHWKLNAIIALQSTPLTTRDGRTLGVISTHWRRPYTPDERALRLLDALAALAADSLDRRDFQRATRAHERRLRAQADAFQATIDGAPLDLSLGILARAITAEVPDARIVFHVADLDMTRLHPIRGADAAFEPYAATWSFPIHTSDGKPLGVLAMFLSESRDVTAADRELVDAMTQTAATIISRHSEARRRADAELSAQHKALVQVERLVLQRTSERDQLRWQLARVEEAERRRLSRELHDQLGQELTAFQLWLEDLARLIRMPRARRTNDARLFSRIEQLQGLAQRMIRGARYISLELRPPELDDLGFESALDTYVREWSARYGIAAGLAVKGSDSLPTLSEDVASAFYRIAQEALTNVARHSRAKNASVVIYKQGGEIRMLVEDDGQGIAEGTSPRPPSERRHGIVGMRERAALVGGQVEIESGPGGTSVYVHVPLQ